MALYLIGDIQGCLDPLQKLLAQVQFDPARDQLWSTGDIVNRGPRSLDTLRFLKNLGSSFRMVLGNHDLHLLAVALTNKAAKRGDTLDEILQAPDADELIDWMRRQPLIIHDPPTATILVHAGIPHIWTIRKALALAQEVEQSLRGPHIADFLRNMYGNEPDCWRDDLAGFDRLRVVTNYLTRMRVCNVEGALDLAFKGPESEIPRGTKAWFSYDRSNTDVQDHIYFGHWAALGSKHIGTRFHALDSGCIWGQCLTLVRREDNRFFSISCQ